MLAEVYNVKNEKVSTIDLPDEIFNAPWRPKLVHQILVALAANSRSPWAHAKGRGEVKGGGKKPWRQKGTGRARAGSIRSPLWRGGGVTFGPSKLRNYKQKINKKMRKSALFSVLSKKIREGELKIIDDFNVSEIKTKKMADVLNKLSGLNKKSKSKSSVLLLPGVNKKTVILSVRNIKKTLVRDPKNLNVSDCLNRKFIFIEKAAVSEITNHFFNKSSK